MEITGSHQHGALGYTAVFSGRTHTHTHLFIQLDALKSVLVTCHCLSQVDV